MGSDDDPRKPPPVLLLRWRMNDSGLCVWLGLIIIVRRDAKRELNVPYTKPTTPRVPMHQIQGITTVRGRNPN